VESLRHWSELDRAFGATKEGAYFARRLCCFSIAVLMSLALNGVAAGSRKFGNFSHF